MRLLPAAAALSLAVSPACAQEDIQVWTAVAATGPVHGDLALFAYAESRAGDDASRLSQTVFGIGAGWEPSPRFSFYGGYLLTTTYRPGADLREHRLWQQAGYAIATAGPVRVSGRTMLEQRIFENDRGLGLRIQQHVRATLPVAAAGRLRLVGYGELLINLNDTHWGARAGLDQVRGFAGVNLPLGRRQTLEAGYFHQRILRAGASDRINHVGLFLLIHRFR